MTEMASAALTAASAPPDRANRVYIIFVWLGIGTLLPWNFFISLSEYWKHKWDTIPRTEDDGSIGVSNSTSSKLNDLQVNWGGNLAVAAMVPNVTILLLNGIFGHRFKTQPRLLISLVFVILLFGFTCAMTKVNTDEWQETFYIVTLVSVVLINVNAAIFQGGLLGVAGKFPPRYIGGVFSGQAIGGIFACATNILFLAMGADVVDAAFFSFLIAVVFLLTAFVSYIIATKSDFFQHFEGSAKKDEVPVPEKSKLVSEDGVKKGVKTNGETPSSSTEEPRVQLPPPKVNPLLILGKISGYAASVYLIFTVTLGCFPAITAMIVPMNAGSGEWTDKYFIPVACFLLFNIGDYIGRVAAEHIRWPKPGKPGMIIVFVLTLLRFVFVPLFLMCSVSPGNRSITSIVFHHDAYYMIFMTLFAISNGYFASVAMMSAPQLFDRPDQQQTASALMVAILGLGLGTGSAVSKAFVKLL